MKRLGGAAAALAVLVLAPLLLAQAGSGQPARGIPKPRPVVVGLPQRPSAHAQVTLGSGPSTRVPRSFLGISTEYWALPIYERYGDLFARALVLLHAPGDGPLLLRIGGVSADQAFWERRLHRVPSWEFELTPQWLAQTRELVHQLGLRVLIDLNLISDDPSTAARWAAAAVAGLPRGSIAGFEIGNEPDIYSRSYWLTYVLNGHRYPIPYELSPAMYEQEFDQFAQDLAPVAPHVPLVGPAIANVGYDMRWINQLIDDQPPGLRTISAHWYAYNPCSPKHSPGYPTISKILSGNASTRMARTLSGPVQLAHEHGLHFRLTEMNSVTCGGLPGVSNSFATALWAPDVLFELLHVGVDGVNIHTRATRINAPFTLGYNGFGARPLMYGLSLFTRMLGPGARLVPLRLQAGRAANLKAWGVEVSGQILHVLLINKAKQLVAVRLHLPGTGPATAQRLTAPSAASINGVTLDGQHLGPYGTWEGTPTTETLMPTGRGYELDVHGVSAVMVTIRLPQELPRTPASLDRNGRSVPREHPRSLQASTQLLATRAGARTRRPRVSRLEPLVR